MAKRKVKLLRAMEILDSRGYPTVQVQLVLDNDISVKASVPSGASTGDKEALELRDGDERYDGKGVTRAVDNVNNIISKAIMGQSLADTPALDKKMIELDGTDNKSKLGANATTAVSLALVRAAAAGQKIPIYKYLRQVYAPDNKTWTMPKPMFNILNGGVHADSGISTQEFMVVPHGDVYKENLRKGAEIFHHLAGLLSNAGYSVSVGDEGGFAPRLSSHQQAFEMLIAAITKVGLVPGEDIKIAIDAAANQFKSGNGRYAIRPEGRTYTTDQLVSQYAQWQKDYFLFSVEDGLEESDWSGWQSMNRRLGKTMMIVGDDLFATHTARLQEGLANNAANAIIIKTNQVGTVSEAVECLKLAQANNYKVIVSHRSGETEDSFIADLAVAMGADFLKAGSVSREERLAKYNRLLEIESEITPNV
ncbi:MAG: phosphopyruvate hydratase [Patescibacteria group bacterium]